MPNECLLVCPKSVIRSSCLKRHILCAILVLLLALVSFEAYAVSPAKRARRNTAQHAFSPWVRYARFPGSRYSLMVVASKTKDNEDAVLTGYTTSPDLQYPVKIMEWQDVALYDLWNLKLYRDEKNNRIICALAYARGDCDGLYVIAVNKFGKTEKLFEDQGRGDPEFRVRGGKPQVYEIWLIWHLEWDMCWHPTKEYDEHVLAERIYTMGRDGRFRLSVTRPAVSEERQLSRKEMRQMLEQRRSAEDLSSED